MEYRIQRKKGKVISETRTKTDNKISVCFIERFFNMKVVIAFDSFKGCMTSVQAGRAAAQGVKRVYTDAEICIRPLADGGEGTVEALISGMNGEFHTVKVSDPLGRPVKATYGIITETHTAVIEMSAAAGITLLSESERNPMNTTTYGVGEIIRDAIKNKCRKFIIGIGGSATNDGGTGMLQALGFGFYDKSDRQVGTGARGLADIVRITDDNSISELSECSFSVACDVKNPLCGEYGCSVVYGPQKGASQKDIFLMDKWLESFAELTKKKYKYSDANLPGTGAAGGMGFAFLSYLSGELKPGVEIILKETEFENYIQNADLVITGEGMIDSQTSMGKAPSGVAKLAKKYGCPVIAFSGAVSEDAAICNQYGIDAFFPVLRKVCSLKDAMCTDTAQHNLSDTVEQVMRVWKVAGQ